MLLSIASPQCQSSRSYLYFRGLCLVFIFTGMPVWIRRLKPNERSVIHHSWALRCKTITPVMKVKKT